MGSTGRGRFGLVHDQHRTLAVEMFHDVLAGHPDSISVPDRPAGSLGSTWANPSAMRSSGSRRYVTSGAPVQRTVSSTATWGVSP
ncbi:hypothetical protein SUDANB1_04989 [Streptomyces sp. enrichment culture]